MEIKDTCLYIHTRKSDGGIFYVGIGDKKRPYSKYRRNRYWRYIVNKHDYDVTILKTNMSWEQACDLEIKMISFYGRKNKKKGCLVNMTDGGDGTKGAIISEETKEKMRKPKTEEHKKKMKKPRSDQGKKNIKENQPDRFGEKNPKARKIICSITGKIYGCIKDAAEDIGVNYNTLYHHLTKNINKTSLRYV
jgi:hypothetical protein